MERSSPRIAVVVLNWNGLSHLRTCLPSVLESQYPDFIVVLADNGSVDGSADWVRREHPRVVVVENGTNLRFAAGNNEGCRRALAEGAEILLLLNNDTTIAPATLRALADRFVEDERVGVVGPRICYRYDPSRIWYGGGRVDLRLGRVRHRAIRRSVDEGRDPVGPTGWVTGCAMAVRRSAWEELGGLDTGYYIYAEDVDFCLRARRRGWRIRYEPSGLVLHDVSATVGGHLSAFKTYHKTRSRLRLVRRHAAWHDWPTLAPALVLQDAATFGYLVVRGALGAAVALLAAWWDAPRSRVRYTV
jgi:GT2 family glycosyltransferase